MNRSVSLYLFSGVVVLLAGVISGCTDLGTDPGPPAALPSEIPTTGATSFQARVLPILSRYGCTGCHGGSGGLFVGTVAQLLTGGAHGAAIVPGNGSTSNLVKKLQTPPPFGSRMPLGGSAVPADTIEVIRKWIDQGALNN